MKRIALVLSALCLSVTTAQAFELVSQDEAQASRDAPPTFAARAVPVPDAPRINLLAPRLDAPVGSPTAIRLKFEAADKASIRPETFKAYYGAFKLDITGRIASAAKITAEGIDVSEARLPKGFHRLTVAVEDSQGRVGERSVSFTVE